MTGTPKTKPAKNDAEWARNVEKKLGAQDNSTALRAGDWVFSTDPDSGNLIAGNRNGGLVVIAVPPAPSDDADAITTLTQPFIKLERQNNQQEPRGTTALVDWDTVAYQTDEWGFVPEASDIGVPLSGIYRIDYHLAFLNSSNAINKGTVFINGATKMAQEFDPDTAWYQSMYMGEIFPLQAGDVVSAGAYVNGSGTFDFGASGADQTVFTSISLLKLPVD